MRVHTLLLPVFALLACCMPACAAAAPWALPGWAYRRTVQVYNAGTTALERPVLALDDLPSLLLINAGRLHADGSDLRLLDEAGAPLPIRPEHLLSDAGDARLLLALPALQAGERRLFTLYYGNPRPEGAAPAADGPPIAAKDVKVSLGAEESALPEPPVAGPALERWLSGFQFREAEAGGGDGFAARPAAAALAGTTSGGALLAAPGGQGRAAFDFPVEAGEYACWVRCLPGAAPGGTLTLAVEQDGRELAPPVNPFAAEDAAGYRWFPLRFTTAKGTARVVARAGGSTAALDCLLLTRDARYRPDYRDFQGRVWVRWRIDAPADYRYWGKIYNDWNPWAAKYLFTGAVTPAGLLPDVVNPYGALPFRTEADFFAAGQYSAWVLLPTSTARDWHAVLYFPPNTPGAATPDGLAARLEFANRPDAGRIFHVTPAEPLEKRTATCGVRMPVTTTLDGLATLETFNEWALRRAALVKGLKLSPPPRLTKLHVGTWDLLSTRLGMGDVPRARAEIDFDELEALGINAAYVDGVDDNLFGELAKAHGMIATNWGTVAENWPYTREGKPGGAYEYRDANETPPQRWQRVMDDFLGKRLADALKTLPNQLALDARINLGDEIGPATNAREIAETPQLLAYFRAWLRGQGLAPADFGTAGWDGVQPLGDRKALGGDTGAKARAFYWTARFADDYTAMFYRAATDSVQKAAGPRLTYVNYQAGPMQCGFIGNDNAMDSQALDIFHLGRERAFTAALTEDWLNGWDMDIARINFGNEVLRASVRPRNLPLANYLVGGQALRARFYAMLGLGVKNIDLYLYGPISNIGPAWAEDPKALADIAAVTREVKKFEDAIAAGMVRPRRAALLVAVTSDIMQKKDLYFLAERHAFFTALAHANLPVDVVSEEQIEKDGALRNYALLYVTDPNVREATQRTIAAWVRGGGRLWACVGAAEWDEYNRPCAVLDPVFGVAKREMITQEKWLPWFTSPYGPHPVKFDYQQLDTLTAASPLLGGALALPAWGMKLGCAPTTARVIGTYRDGAPALLLNACGTGQALLTGALVGEAYVRSHYPATAQRYPEMIKRMGVAGWSFDDGAPARRLAVALAGAAKATRPVALSVPGIYASVMDSPRGTLLFLNNAASVMVADRTTALVPIVVVTLPETRKIRSVTSNRTGTIPFTQKKGMVSFTVALPDTAVFLLTP